MRQTGRRSAFPQYGECGEERAAFRARCGAAIAESPELDLFNDIEGLAALCAAFDLTLSVANATGMLAGACGTTAALISGPRAWSRLGSERFPWCPQAHALTAPPFCDWGPAMAEAATMAARLARERPIPAGPR